MRAAARTSPAFAAHAGRDELAAFLDGLDLVVSVLPATPDDRRAPRSRRDARASPTARTWSTSAAATSLVEDDLLALIDSGKLSGATLDVFREEPLPPGASVLAARPRSRSRRTCRVSRFPTKRSRRSPARSAPSSAASRHRRRRPRAGVLSVTQVTGACRRRASACAASTRRRGLCAGCLRTLDEIAAWSVLDDDAAARGVGRDRARAARCASHADRTRMATVDWYFDFISPFAYLQSEQLALLGPKTRIRYRPVLFAGLLAANAHKGPAEIPRKRVFTYRFVVWQAKRLRIPFKMPHEHPFNPLPLLRLAIACDCAPEAVHRIFRFVWRDGRLPDLPIEWAELVHDLRLPDAERRIADPEVKAALRRNTDEAIARGVFGVPTLDGRRRAVLGRRRNAMAADYLAPRRTLDRPRVRARRDAAHRRRAQRGAEKTLSREPPRASPWEAEVRQTWLADAQIRRARNAERALDRARGRERLVERLAEARDVPHLAAAPRLGLAVQVQLGGRMAQHLAPRGLARRVAARRRTTGRPAGSPSRPACAGACRPAAGPASTRACCSNCDVTHASIVKWPLLCGRGAISLTSSVAVARDEHLHAQHAAVVERRRDARRRCRARGSASVGGDARGHDRHVEDAVAVAILRDRPRRTSRRARCARRSPTPRRRARCAARARTAAPLMPRHAARTSSTVATARLALAVVAEARALHDAGQEPRASTRVDVGVAAQHRERRHGEAVARQEHLLADPVLRDGHARRRRASRARCCARKSSAAAGTFSNSVVAAAASAGQLARARARRGSRRRCAGRRRCRPGSPCAGIEHRRPVAQALRGHAEHAAELAAAQQAEPCAGRDRGHCRRLRSRAARASRARSPSASTRNAASLRARAGSVAAMSATAKRPALAAPASPIAKVATGMPLGICTIDSSESSPRRYFDGTGTPSTGHDGLGGEHARQVRGAAGAGDDARAGRAGPRPPRTRTSRRACGARTARAARWGCRRRRAAPRRAS